MPPKTSQKILQDTLENLSKANFEKFCSDLLDQGDGVKVGQVEGKDFLQIAKLMISTYNKIKALKVAEDILRGIRCEQEADDLVEEVKKAGLQSSAAASSNVKEAEQSGSQPLAAASSKGDMMPANESQKKEEVYELRSQPVGLCLIINNENFTDRDKELADRKKRRGTNKDAERLAKVFSWLGFRVLMCKDQTGNEMQQTLKIFASARNSVLPQELDVQEWSDIWRKVCRNTPLQHGDAFVCCILSHGDLGQVLGVDSNPVAIKEMRSHFKATDQSALTGKPKVFLIQACQGTQNQRGVRNVEEDSSTTPEYADFLIAVSTVEDYKSFREPEKGSWFIQSVCEQLETHCRSGEEEITSILHRVHYQVGQKEGYINYDPKPVKQVPEFRDTLRKKLVLTPR